MMGQVRKAFKADCPFERPEAAARELLRIVKSRLTEGQPHTYTGVVNSEFLQSADTSVAMYSAGRDFAITNRWFEIDASGTRIFLLPAGAELGD